MNNNTELKNKINKNIKALALKDKMDIDNSYRIILNSRIGCVEKNSVGNDRLHSNFEITIPTIPKSNIKDAMVRIRSMFIPARANIDFNFCYVATNFLKLKTFESRDNITASAGGFQVTNEGYLSGKLLGCLSISAKVFPQFTDGDDGDETFFKITSDGEIIEGSNVPIVGVNDCVGGFTSEKILGYEAKPLNDDWIPCKNPFGETLSFQIYQQSNNGNGNLEFLPTGDLDTEQILLELEIKLLPNLKPN